MPGYIATLPHQPLPQFTRLPPPRAALFVARLCSLSYTSPGLLHASLTGTRTHTQTRGHMALPVNVGIKICLSCDDNNNPHSTSVRVCVCASFVWPYNRYNNKNNANALCALTQFPFLDTAQQAHRVGEETERSGGWGTGDNPPAR